MIGVGTTEKGPSKQFGLLAYYYLISASSLAYLPLKKKQLWSRNAMFNAPSEELVGKQDGPQEEKSRPFAIKFYIANRSSLYGP